MTRTSEQQTRAALFEAPTRQELDRYRHYPTLLSEMKNSKAFLNEHQTIGFMDMPTEIRVKILRLNLKLGMALEMWGETGCWVLDERVRAQNNYYFNSLFGCKGINIRLLRVAKQFSSEAAEIFYGENEFRFSGVGGPVVACGFLETIRLRHFQWIKRFTVALPLVPESRGSDQSRNNIALRNGQSSVMLQDTPFRFPFHLFYLLDGRKIDYEDACRMLMLNLAKMCDLKILSFVLPEWFRQSPRHADQNAIPFEQIRHLMAAKPCLQLELVHLRYQTDLGAYAELKAHCRLRRRMLAEHAKQQQALVDDLAELGISGQMYGCFTSRGNWVSQPDEISIGWSNEGGSG